MKSKKIAKQKQSVTKKKGYKKALKPFRWLYGKTLKPVVTYFKESWQELRQVRWTDRRTTWGMTLAVIGFSVFFIVLIVLLDLGFQKLFEIILK